MKKIFLTSGIVLCMACPAFATDINYSNSTYSDADCVSDVLGVTSGEQTLHAKWQRNQYTIQYAPGTARNLDGTVTGHIHEPSLATGLTAGTDDRQTATYDESSVLKQGSIYVAPAGYRFVEWKADYLATTGAETPYTDATQTGGTSYAAGATINPYKVDGTLTLTALWAPLNYTVTYNKNNHAANGVDNYDHENGAQMDKNYTALTGGAAASQTGIYATPGYTFRGWSRSADSIYTGTEADTWVWTGETPYVEHNDLTVYAIYSANQYTLTYDCGSYADAQNGVGPKNASYISTLSDTSVWTYDSEHNTVSHTFTFDSTGTSALNPVNVCQLAGYHVTTTGNNEPSWTCTMGDTPVNYSDVTSANWSIVGNVKCSITWTPNEINLIWNTNGGATLSEGDDACTYDLGFDPKTPSKTGYTFKGWTTATSAPSTADYIILDSNGNPSYTQPAQQQEP